MKKKQIILGSVMLGALTLGAIAPNIFKKSQKEMIGEDNALYGDRLEVDYNNPDVVFPKEAGEATVKAASVSIRYHDPAYDSDPSVYTDREFWIWGDSANGEAHEASIKTDSDGFHYIETSFDFTGDYATFYGGKRIFFIVKYKKGTPKGGGDGWQNKTLNIEVEYKDEFVPNKDGHVDIWGIPSEGSDVEVYGTKEGTTTDRFLKVSFDKDWKSISVKTTSSKGVQFKLYALTSNYMNNTLSANLEDYLIAYGTATKANFKIMLKQIVRVNVQYLLTGVFPDFPQYTKKKYVAADAFYETPRFKQYYEYTGNDLGCTYNDDKSTTFKVWAPASANVRVYLYNSGSESKYKRWDETATDSPAGGYNMAFRPGGVWELTIKNKDLKGMYYRYYVANSLGQQETMDPYAKACGVNGDRAMIVDWKETNPDGWDSVPAVWDGVEGYDIKNPNDLSIYETHIRDLTMDSSWTGSSMRGTYSAFAEKGTRYSDGTTEVTTGYDHIEEFGVKAIQLIPVFDNDNLEGTGNIYVDGEDTGKPERTYNWGYNPLNYNCVDGSYATDPYNGISRIKEYKSLIKAYSENANHTRIIMDVVYNHVSSIAQHCFTKLMPKYYFRYNSSGSPYDGSGCGNEVKSEAPMMSKYIVDSLCWWAKEYKVKGFRFDLMGLIDWQTIKKAAQELYKIDKDIYLYGEGWASFGGCHLDPTLYPDNWGADTWHVYNKLYKQGEMCYVGCFNDKARNEIAGETGNINDWGFVLQGGTHAGKKSISIADMLVGYHTGSEYEDDHRTGANPNQMVAYSSCHDDFSTYDHIWYLLREALQGDDRRQMADVAAAVASVESTIMMTNGVAFIQGGQEIFLSKQVTQADIEEYGDEVLERCATVEGVKVSSNSYKLRDETNSIKWDRKIAIPDLDNGTKVPVNQFYQGIRKACNERNKMAKYDYDYLQAHNPFNTSADGLKVLIRGDGSNKVQINNGNYTFITAGNTGDGCADGFVSYQYEASATKVFTSNPGTDGQGKGYNVATGGINMWWYTSVLFKR